MLDPSVSQHLLHCKDILKYGMLAVTGDKFETLLQTKISPLPILITAEGWKGVQSTYGIKL
jgi:hypothetical protein